jgi:hypothetical protein
MTTKLFLALLSASLALASIARADRFYFGSADRESKMDKDAADYIEGVLLSKDGGLLQIRVVGGTITVPESSVYKIEPTALTENDIAGRERDRAEALAAADVRRRELRADEAERWQQRLQVQPPEQRELTIVIDLQGLLPNYVFKVLDPVLQRADLSGLAWVIESYLQEQIYRAAHRFPPEPLLAPGY